MAKGASGSQAATLVPRAGGGATTGGSAAARAPPTAAGLRKRTSEFLIDISGTAHCDLMRILRQRQACSRSKGSES